MKGRQEIVLAKEWFLVGIIVVKILITLKTMQKWVSIVQLLVHFSLLSPLMTIVTLIPLNPLIYLHNLFYFSIMFDELHLF